MALEWAAEIANRTVHGIMHIGWGPGRDRRLPRPDGRPGEPNGLLGIGYMAVIRPFRHLIVYPC
jgi:hypothetical protein